MFRKTNQESQASTYASNVVADEIAIREILFLGEIVKEYNKSKRVQYN